MFRGLLVVALLSCPVIAAAQDTRAGMLEKQRAEKATQLRPYELLKLEKTLLWVEEHDPLQKIAPHNGFFLEYGYTGKPVGSGVAFGGGWRHDLFDRNARVVFEAGHSIRGYRMGRADFSMPYLADETFEVGLEGAYREQPQEDFYGLGFESQRGDRVNFEYRAPDVQARAMVKPVRWFNAGVRFGRVAVSLGRGKDSRYPSIEERFTDADAPGLDEQPDFTYVDLFTTLDTRDQPGNARAGSYAGLQWRRYNDLDLDQYNFDRIDLDAQQFLPIFDKKRVVAVRLQLSATTAEDGMEVPFYFMPTLGGGASLRSYSDYRYRDRNVLAMNVEYRWEAFSGLDMALFSDFGTVAPRFSGLEFARVRGAYGLGLRFNTSKAVFLRIDFAAGGTEGLRTLFKFSQVF